MINAIIRFFSGDLFFQKKNIKIFHLSRGRDDVKNIIFKCLPAVMNFEKID